MIEEEKGLFNDALNENGICYINGESYIFPKGKTFSYWEIISSESFLKLLFNTAKDFPHPDSIGPNMLALMSAFHVLYQYKNNPEIFNLYMHGNPVKAVNDMEFNIVYMPSPSVFPDLKMLNIKYNSGKPTAVDLKIDRSLSETLGEILYPDSTNLNKVLTSVAQNCEDVVKVKEAKLSKVTFKVNDIEFTLDEEVNKNVPFEFLVDIARTGSTSLNELENHWRSVPALDYSAVQVDLGNYSITYKKHKDDKDIYYLDKVNGSVDLVDGMCITVSNAVKASKPRMGDFYTEQLAQKVIKLRINVVDEFVLNENDVKELTFEQLVAISHTRSHNLEELNTKLAANPLKESDGSPVSLLLYKILFKPLKPHSPWLANDWREMKPFGKLRFSRDTDILITRQHKEFDDLVDKNVVVENTDRKNNELVMLNSPDEITAEDVHVVHCSFNSYNAITVSPIALSITYTEMLEFYNVFITRLLELGRITEGKFVDVSKPEEYQIIYHTPENLTEQIMQLDEVITITEGMVIWVLSKPLEEEIKEVDPTLHNAKTGKPLTDSNDQIQPAEVNFTKDEIKYTINVINHTCRRYPNNIVTFKELLELYYNDLNFALQSGGKVDTKAFPDLSKPEDYKIQFTKPNRPEIVQCLHQDQSLSIDEGTFIIIGKTISI